MLKLLKGLSLIICTMVIVGCSDNNIDGDYKVYIEKAGINDCSLDYYFYTTSYDGFPDRYLCAYDINFEESKIVFAVPDIVTDRILEYKITSDDVKILVDEDGEYSYWTYNIADDEVAENDYENLNIEDETLSTNAIISTASKTVYFKKDYSDLNYYYSFDGENYLILEGLTFQEFSRSGIFESNLFCQDEVIYGIITGVKKSFTGPPIIMNLNNISNCDVSKDILFAFDCDNQECEILYDTNSGDERIVGYKEGYVYTYKNGKLFEFNLKTNKNEQIYEINLFNVYFYWMGTKLIIFDSEGEEVYDVIDV